MSMSDNVVAWESEFFDREAPILKFMERYNAARNGFSELVKQIRFMPNTKEISAEMIKEIAHTNRYNKPFIYSYPIDKTSQVNATVY